MISTRGFVLLAASCAAWAAWFTQDLVPARYVIPVLTLLGVLLLERWPVRAAFGLVGLLAVYPLMDVHVTNGSFLMPTLVACFVVGRLAPVWPGLAVVAGFDAAMVMDLPTVPDALFGVVLFGGTWLFGVLIQRRIRAARAAGAEQARLEAEDQDVLVARVVAHERTRLAADTVDVVREAVTRMRATAAEARHSLDPVLLTEITERGAVAVTDLRRLIGLLRNEPEASHSPPVLVGRRPWRLDLLTAVAAATITVLEVALLPGVAADRASVVCTLLLCAALGLRRTDLAAALALAIGVQAAGVGVGAAPLTGLGGLLAWGLLAWSVGAHGTRTAWLLFVVYCGLLLSLVQRAEPGNLLFAALALAGPAMAGRAWSERDREYEAARSKALALLTERDVAISRAVARERLRIARELHDVTSHAVGVMVLQAGAANAQRAIDPVRARRAIDIVEAAGRQAESELGVLLQALAVPALDSMDLETSLPALVDRVRAGGLQIALVQGDLPAGPAGRDAYRVVQEALTNVARHAPGSQVTVNVDKNAVEVVNGPGRPTRTAPGSGFGLVGLSERVRTLDGTLEAGPLPDGGFAVRVALPSVRTIDRETIW